MEQYYSLRLNKRKSVEVFGLSLNAHSLSTKLSYSPIWNVSQNQRCPTCDYVKYDAPEEVGGDRIFFDSPIRKLGLVQILDVNSSKALTLYSLTVFCCP